MDSTRCNSPGGLPRGLALGFICALALLLCTSAAPLIYDYQIYWSTALGGVSLDDNPDVDTAGKASGDLLTWDGANWVDASPASMGLTNYWQRNAGNNWVEVATAGDDVYFGTNEVARFQTNSGYVIATYDPTDTVGVDYGYYAMVYDGTQAWGPHGSAFDCILERTAVSRMGFSGDTVLQQINEEEHYQQSGDPSAPAGSLWSDWFRASGPWYQNASSGALAYLSKARADSGTTYSRHGLNLIAGSNITITPNDDSAGDEVEFTIAASGGGGGYDTIQEDGAGLTQRTTLDFVGSAFTASDTGAKTQVDGDSDLDALASNSTNGLWARTGAGTGAARTITAGDGINVLNGDGSGNPIIATAGNLILNYQAVTGSGSTTLLTTGGFVLVTLSGGVTHTINLPAASGNDGQVYFIRRTDFDFTSTCTIAPNGTDAWEGTASGTYSLGVAGTTILACDGSGWWMVSQS